MPIDPDSRLFSMQVVEIEYGSQLYQDELELRDIILRQPLGLSVYDEITDDEANYWHFGITEDNALVACLITEPMNDGSANAGQMAVAEHLQGKGIGKQLVKEVESIIVSRGINLVSLSARMDAVDFYKKLGYEITGEPFTKVNIPHVVMTKELMA